MGRVFAASLLKRMALVLLCGAIGRGPAHAQQDHKSWKDYGSGADNSKYIALDQFTKSNLSGLKTAWSYPTRDNLSYVFNPIIVDNVMYVLARSNSLVALDATTGKEIWVHENLRGISSRGINYWESKDRTDRRLLLQINVFLEEIDARTGKSILTFGKNGLVDLREGLGRDPGSVARIKSDTPGRVFENLIILGSSTGEAFLSPPGDLRAFDVISGRMVWTFHTIPHPGEPGYDTWPKDAWKYAGGTNAWGEISVDEKRGIAYFPIGSSTYDMYGADRIGANLYANCLLALDAHTGKHLWHFQLVHHDLWDYDPTAAPQLITVQHDSKRVDAVAQSTKHGFLYAFNRVTGEPLWPVEERPVPKSDVPGEQSWPTQPFPTLPPPFARQKMTPDDVNPYLLTAEERAHWKDKIASARNEGLFTPPAWNRDTVELPGARGGSNWGSTAANPDKGLVYVLTQDWPSFPNVGKQIATTTAAGGRGAASSPGQTTYQRNCQPCHGADRSGGGPVPSLVDLKSKFKFEDFQQLVVTGRGEMPAFPGLDRSVVQTLFQYLGDPSGRLPGRFARDTAPAAPLGGPVEASGGAPGGLDVTYNEQAQAARYADGGGRFSGPPYPEGIEAPAVRYYSDYALNNPEVISPPWSSLVAYDLNTGAIKWKVPLGDDQEVAKAGGKNTGLLRGGERRGIVVTSTGLLFVNARDGKLRAFDADDGKVLWEESLPAGSDGIPAMYQVNGRQYLVVAATSNLAFGRTRGSFGPATGPVNPKKAYVAFALSK